MKIHNPALFPMAHKQSANLARRLLKGVALLQLFLALALLVFDVKVSGHSSWSIVSVMIAGALVMIFCAPEKVNDERVDQLKLKAGKAGLLAGTLLAMFANLYASMTKASIPLSAFDVLILIMLIALACFYLWRWHDSRPAF